MEFAELILTPKLDNVILHAGGDSAPVAGTLCITGHHLILSTRKEDTQELWVSMGSYFPAWKTHGSVKFHERLKLSSFDKFFSFCTAAVAPEY